jgi:hypothetical protein
MPVKTARKEGAAIVIAVAVNRSMHTCEESKSVKNIF